MGLFKCVMLSQMEFRCLIGGSLSPAVGQYSDNNELLSVQETQLVIISVIMVVNCLEPKVNNDINNDIKTIMGKYLSKIPDMEPRYVLNDKLSSIINHYFKGKISSLPLYKISLKIDRNPVKIPWTLSAVNEPQGDTVLQRAQLSEQEDSKEKNVKHYKVLKVSGNRLSTEKPVKMGKASNTATPVTLEPTMVEIQ